jgi:DNA mismatch repair protein MutS
MSDPVKPVETPAEGKLSAVESKLSPAMRQYAAFKRQHPDYILLFRMGDFYEMFWEDAKTASRVLGITLTTRDKNSQDPVPMAGVPFHSVEGYLRRLIRAGLRVAVCEQVEDAKLAKGVVKRDVTRLITPGTLTDEPMLDAGVANYLAAISFVVTKSHGRRTGLAWADLSTGHCSAMSGDEETVIDQLARLSAAEVLLPETTHGEEHPLAARLRGAGIRTITTRPAWQFAPFHAIEQIRSQYHVNTVAGFGFDSDDDAGVVATGAILTYLRETQRTSLGHLRTPVPHRVERHLLIDPATYRSLEIERTTRGNSVEGSLIHAIDRTRTGMGSRLLRQWMRFPLTDLEYLQSRQNAVATLHAEPVVRGKVAEALRDLCDIERIVARVAVGRCSPRDLASLGATLGALPGVIEPLETLPDGHDVVADLTALRPIARQLSDRLTVAVRDDPAPHLREGGVIAVGFDPELDRLRQLTVNSQQWLAEYQAQLASQTGISNLKVSYNKVFGYYIEVTDTHRSKVPPEWSRRQTVRNAERYITDELKRFEDEATTARERSIQLEQQLFENLRQQLLPHLNALQELAQSIARLDVLVGFAQLAHERRYCKPTLTPERVLHVVDGRHPVLEQQISSGESASSSAQFVPNDTHFDPPHTLMLITGPNMAGKSTYIRQAALIALLAQVGAFVPATSATVGIVDRLFARIGASDEIHAGQSTFMVEMTETANILNNATDRSLIVLDEIGRGTSTLDGLSLAWAIAEHLAGSIRARTLFATHYHELTQLAETDPGVRNFNVAVREWEDQVIFLHRIVEGGTDRSYGIHVARLAGVPRSVLDRAKDLLSQLAVHHVGHAPRVEPTRPKPHEQMMLFAYEPSGLSNALDAVDPDDLSPREALELLRKWKDQFTG